MGWHGVGMVLALFIRSKDVGMYTTSFVVITIRLDDYAVESTGFWQLEKNQKAQTIADAVAGHVEKLCSSNVETFVREIDV